MGWWFIWGIWEYFPFFFIVPLLFTLLFFSKLWSFSSLPIYLLSWFKYPLSIGLVCIALASWSIPNRLLSPFSSSSSSSSSSLLSSSSSWYQSTWCPFTQVVFSFSSFTQDWPYLYLKCPRPPPLGDLAHSASTLLAQVVQQELPSPHLLLNHRHALFDLQVLLSNLDSSDANTPPSTSFVTSPFVPLRQALSNCIETNQQTVRALVKLHVCSTSVLDRLTLTFQTLLLSHPSLSSSSSSSSSPPTSVLLSNYLSLIQTLDQEISHWHHVLLQAQHHLAHLESSLSMVYQQVSQTQHVLQTQLDQTSFWLRQWYQLRGGVPLSTYLQTKRFIQVLTVSTHQVQRQRHQLSHLNLLLNHFETHLEQFKKSMSMTNLITTQKPFHVLELHQAMVRLQQAKQIALNGWEKNTFLASSSSSSSSSLKSAFVDPTLKKEIVSPVSSVSFDHFNEPSVSSTWNNPDPLKHQSESNFIHIEKEEGVPLS